MGSTAVCNPKAINLIFSCPCSVLQGSQTWAGCRQQLRWHELLISPCQPPPGQWLRHGQARPFVPQEQSKPICPQKQQQQHRVLCSPSFGSIPGWMHTRVQIHGGLALTNEGDNQNKDLRPQTLLSKGYGMLSQDFENIFAIASWTGITGRTACMKKEG